MSGTWASEPDSRLSQGDVLADVGFARIAIPPVSLKKTTGKGGHEVWTPQAAWPSTGQKPVDCLASGNIAPALVVTHSCELDKPAKRGLVLVAPIRLASALQDGQREAILARQKIAFVPLPALPGFGDCYADLRATSAISRSPTVATAMILPPRARTSCRFETTLS